MSAAPHSVMRPGAPASSAPQTRRLSLERVRLLGEAGLMLGVSYVAVKLVPMRFWSSFLGTRRGSGASGLGDDQVDAVNMVCSAVSAWVRRLPVRIVCLPQSMARHLMLRRRGIGSSLRIGMRPRPGGGMDVHAWTAVGPAPVPDEDVSSYSVVSTFS